jgi:hypothetical protein
MNIKGIDDIEREKKEEERIRTRNEITSDISQIFRGLKKQRQAERRNKPLWIKVVKLLAIIGLLGLVLNFVLANFWLFRFFIKDLFVK